MKKNASIKIVKLARGERIKTFIEFEDSSKRRDERRSVQIHAAF